MENKDPKNAGTSGAAGAGGGRQNLYKNKGKDQEVGKIIQIRSDADKQCI